jgi:hypothetical protein
MSEIIQIQNCNKSIVTKQKKKKKQKVGNYKNDHKIN